MVTKRLTTIDIAKAIAIILVVIGHYHPDNSLGWYDLIVRLIYSFHMPLFMFASGYIYIATRKEGVNYFPFIRKKFLRLMIPYFSTSVIVITMKLLMEGKMDVDHPVTFSSFYQMFYYPVAGYFLWFVFSLFEIFLIAPFFKTKRQILLLLAISGLLYFLPVSFPEILCLEQTKHFMLYFCLGMVAFVYKHVTEYFKRIPPYVCGILFLLCFFLRSACDSLPIVIQLVYGLHIAVLGILSICNFSRRIDRKENAVKSVLLHVASASYIIYLFHTTFEGFMKAVLHKIPLDNCMNEEFAFLIIALIVILSGLFLPYLLQKGILEKNQTLCFLFGLTYKLQK